MEFWSVLFVTVLSGPLEGSTSGLIYKNFAECEAAIPAVVGTFDGQYDYTIWCEESTTLSASVKPKRNPIYGG